MIDNRHSVANGLAITARKQIALEELDLAIRTTFAQFGQESQTAGWPHQATQVPESIGQQGFDNFPSDEASRSCNENGSIGGDDPITIHIQINSSWRSVKQTRYFYRFWRGLA